MTTGFLEAQEVRTGAQGALEKPYLATRTSWTMRVSRPEDKEQEMTAMVEAVRDEIIDAGADAVIEGARIGVKLPARRAKAFVRRSSTARSGPSTSGRPGSMPCNVPPSSRPDPREPASLPHRHTTVRTSRRSIPVAVTTVVSVVIAVIAVVATTSTAASLSCAPHPDPSPQAIATGTEQTATGTRVLDEFDLVVIGTVTAIVTITDEGSRYGDTSITMDVHGVLGSTDPIERIVLSADDPGWMSGYPFEAGHHYSVPIRTHGPDGQVNHTFLCDPIAEVDDPEAVAVELVEITATNGLAFARPDGPTRPTTTGAATVLSRPELAAEETADRRAGSSSWPWAVAAAIAVVAVGLAVATGVVGRSRGLTARED